MVTEHQNGNFDVPYEVHALLRARDWQDRPQLDELCNWWKDGGFGICSLVGIGGAGKTAILDRFLLLLPGGYPEQPRVTKLKELPSSKGLFIFSFYDAPSPDAFFFELKNWLLGQREKEPSFRELLSVLGQSGRCILVLDGLEKVQEDGLRGTYGHISDGLLRKFILSIADFRLPDVSLIITSRFRLFDPLAERSSYTKQINVEKLPTAACIQLLRERGVKSGTDAALERLAHDYGRHALSVDLVGGFIARFHNGDPSEMPPIGELDFSGLDERLNPLDRAIADQERRLGRITQRYKEALAERDPAALALLQRLSLFRIAVSANTLAAIFTGNGKQAVSGPALAAISNEELKHKLHLLVEMRLLELQKASYAGQEAELFTAHPAIRDEFSRQIDSATAIRGHEAVRRGLEASLGKKPGSSPSTTSELDLLEEIIRHAVKAHQYSAAAQIYLDRMGGRKNLIGRLGEYVRVSRITQSILGPVEAPSALGLAIPLHICAVLCNDAAASSLQLGQLQCAEFYLKKGMSISNQIGGAEMTRLTNQLCHLQWDRGYLSDACQTLKQHISLHSDPSAGRIHLTASLNLPVCKVRR